ncbi:methyltransferase domain-containing protein [Halocatena salina]|uniref:Methyltransferase domain-containing protein n=1 Tax=Halocatena salina TaxID=2934340 RepID=A0A8U0A5I8_9EURY|nr:methyltransferase domain-containing protein [Halocatena salina]UPM43738.1 methyltransferase domain-containing protein [Halocatena salina]
MAKDEPSDEEERELWDRLLTTTTEEEFRKFVIDQLALRPDESVLSVGCGPGFETAALAQHITEEGSITGIDLNEEVLAAAKDRCGDFSQVSFKQGDITDLPVADGRYDLAIAKQVFSQISDVESALNELYRVIKRDGRMAVTAGDRRTHVKHTPTDRMQRADDIYRSEMTDRQRGTRLVGLLPETGFSVEKVIPRAKIQTEINAQIERGIEIQRRFLQASDTFDDAEIETWEQELRELDEADQFLSCGTAFLYLVRKPE